ncbi:hypothetical protein AAZX31_09G036300 [Glycine max]|uniref:Uncharacterized protein n=2 Tax=Glycine subgen. Soja TaxID=1462606 RepID=I1L0S0_SOYBN|nr:uncharacterized protein LOC100781987 [Glycine max]XP_028180036.1 uncharacterized protein LOC114367129 [Glycine soja]KAG4990424.1 hypothetical protein JHK87_023881 [Glycine soja]KAG5005947.1 hypothetical protein JHK85_024489 [Glycine max]KAG5011735.1 hypothetical protein JHK86_023996 [Glycine max]KAG5132739.1 hypothetical protein JHK82_023927 [Glycine max]KAH1041344.1 hypothetical protein GYH30_023940 [Glycine max]|eukprot:XP_003533183.1 uncharacterized protein LOC100781987 [Glycine max]
MGTGHSTHTNLGSECTSYDAGATGTIARWGESFEVSMGNSKENNDHTEVWGVKYKPSQKNYTCGFHLRASRDNNKSVESIYFGLGDFSNNKTEFALKITRIGRDSLRGGITGIDSSTAPMYFTRAKQDHTIETTIVPYGCSFRDGLFVMEMKKKVNAENAYMVTMGHYYVTKDVGLSVEAKILRSKNCFVVQVEGPFSHPGDELRKVLAKTHRTGIWSRSACSHCNNNGTKASTSKKSGESDSPLKAQPSHQKGHGTVGEIVSHAFSSSVKEQYNKGLINSSGYTTGSLNNSIVFIDCNF